MEAAVLMSYELRWVVTLVEWDETTGAVINVLWKVEVSDGETTVEVPGACRFDPTPQGKNFIPLDSVTEEVVLEWVKKRTPNYLNTEKRAIAKFEAAKKIPSASGRGLPWSGVEIPKVVPKIY